MPRVQVNTDLGAPDRVQTSAQPRGIQAPVATTQPSKFTALAESLSSLRPAINGYLEEAKTIYREEEAARAYDTIQGMTYEESRAAIESGEMRGTESPWYQAAFQKQFGIAHAMDRRRQIVSDYNTSFDKENGDIDAFLASYAQADYEEYGDSEFIRSGIREGMDGTFETIRNSHAEYRDAQTRARATEQFYTIAGGTVDAAVGAGGDVGAAITAIGSEHADALGLTPDEMDAQLVALAERYASEGNVAAAEAVLGADPWGRGPLTSRAGFDEKSRTILDTAGARAGDAYRVANTDPIVGLRDRANRGLLDEGDLTQITTWRDESIISQAEAESYLLANRNARAAGAAEAAEMNVTTAYLNSTWETVRAGLGYSVQDVTIPNPNDPSKTITLKAEDLIDTVAQEQLSAMAANGTAPNVMAAQLAQWGLAGVTYAPWEAAMNGGINSLSVSLTAAGEGGSITLPPAASAGYVTWKALEDQPTVRNQHVSAEAASIYRDAEVLERVGSMSPEDALLASAGIDRASPRTNLTGTVERTAFAAAVQTAVANGIFGEAAVNGSTVSAAIEKDVRILMDMGLTMGDAITEAGKSFSSSYTVMNGVAINTRDQFIPQNFEAISAARIETQAAASGEDAEDLTMIPWGSNQNFWRVVYRSSLAPVAGSAPIHISDLQRLPASFTMEDANAAVAEAIPATQEAARREQERLDFQEDFGFNNQ